MPRKRSADQWVGQTDEEELGISYGQIDKLRYRMIDQCMTRDELPNAGFAFDFIDTISTKIQNSHFRGTI